MNGYPADPDPLAPAKGIRNILLLSAGFWLVVFVVLQIAFRT